MKSCLTSTPFYFLVLIITSCMHSCCFSHLSLPLPFITVHTFRNHVILKTQLKLTPWPQTSAVSFQACVCSRGPSSRPVLLEAQSSLAFSTASLMGSVHTHRLLTSLLVRTLQPSASAPSGAGWTCSISGLTLDLLRQSLHLTEKYGSSSSRDTGC